MEDEDRISLFRTADTTLVGIQIPGTVPIMSLARCSYCLNLWRHRLAELTG